MSRSSPGIRILEANTDLATKNLFFLSANVTVLDDGDQDTMLGGNGRDWFFSNLNEDLISDLDVNELIEELS